MPECLAPGVYVEEVSFRAVSIDGVTTTTTGVAGGAHARETVHEALTRSLCALHPRSDAKRVHRVARIEQEESAPEQGSEDWFAHLGHPRFAVWGAEHLSSDPEWKYVNVRRYFIYLEHSIDEGTEWAVFEPNSEPVVRELTHGLVDAVLADRDETVVAYVVRCERRDCEPVVCDVRVAALG